MTVAGRASRTRLSFTALYTASTSDYRAEFAGLMVSDEYAVSAQTPIGASEAKASFRIVCAPGYERSLSSECAPPQSP